MNQTDRYTRFGLCRDMLATPGIVRRFQCDRMQETAEEIARVGRLLLTGEGSSRIFPAKSMIQQSRRRGWPLQVATESGLQLQESDLRDWTVFALSNSGRTAEVVGLFSKLAESGHPHRYSLTAFADTRLESLATRGFILDGGPEGAVAATKSVMEQALFYRALLEHAHGVRELADQLESLSLAVSEALETSLEPAMIQRVARAPTVYWAGRNDGVAEELTLKTNEIVRKPADFLEGTYAVHGVEEVLLADDVLLWIDPYPAAEEKFAEVLEQGIGLAVIAIASRETAFPTIRIPDHSDLNPFVQLAAGWNLLVEVGLELGFDLDKPQRVRRIRNEVTKEF